MAHIIQNCSFPIPYSWMNIIDLYLQFPIKRFFVFRLRCEQFSWTPYRFRFATHTLAHASMSHVLNALKTPTQFASAQRRCAQPFKYAWMLLFRRSQLTVIWRIINGTHTDGWNKPLKSFLNQLFALILLYGSIPAIYNTHMPSFCVFVIFI